MLPFVTAPEFALPNLPTELWTIILRSLDPSSLIIAVKSIDLWKRISQEDSVLRQTVKNQLLLEKRRRRENMLNPGLLLSITREGAGRLFASNARKIIRLQFPAQGPVKTQERRKRCQNESSKSHNHKVGRNEYCKIML
ncbi:hypothetical protein Zmor_001552 [Zophobas morio]|uniref:F-box domain-containing protein n=1 Tax=Zophobas morio TaxID=2755281 RepID=A0AA38MSQ7_9CUCU|nr:hypothetical protein Zmor_001552 [Zophobas morio]